MWVFDARLAHFHRVGGGFSSIELMLCEADVEKLYVEMGRAGKSIKTKMNKSNFYCCLKLPEIMTSTLFFVYDKR